MVPGALGELARRRDLCQGPRAKWAYLYRAVDKFGDTIDFYLSATRNTKAAKRFLGKALRGWKDWELPEVVNTDKAPTYAGAIAELKAEGKCPQDTRHRQVKYLNNVVAADHGKLKQLIRPVRGFKTLKTAYATIKGFEVMRALRKGQARVFALQDGIVGEARIVERAFGVGPCALTGYIPTALVALTIIDAERLCDRLNARLGFSRDGWTALPARSMRDERPQPGDRTAH